MDDRSLGKLASLKRRLAKERLENQRHTLDTFDFSQIAKKPSTSQHPAEVFDPKIPTKDITIKVKKKVRFNKKGDKSAESPAKEKKSATKKAKSKSKLSNPPINPSNKSDSNSKWKKRMCKQCTSIFPIHIDWKNPSRYCKSCRDSRRKSLKKTSPKNDRTQYTFSSIYQGGSPGGGKRR
ncbi:MAG: hypothetical protein JJT87_19305 [Halomonas sp.]|nr:hypothetical protein [Halomonas sp.]MCC5904064.1 hypothetical protein [Halomonas sp.]